ncbi:hypothetical protein FNF27_02792 [Cafeteria roenbergensis]|uniref:Thioredoxin-like fold domain-containing protein n=1 Tax=Cafeteria roenbergensis TaxID=33653 RepID=A0A5A8ED23_CAFRO|nr:hypothetical protein FNF29_03166 [Cafeteria roenbergensis]KAA0156925.1 hypothetical protein FNF31_05848 [Cafeteria roenbergensis]KAA0170921.1 hypothetical protein FNF28_01194 [Cafeteria roenbergensis]KAA0175706.1 hypothetical protein FNF27_02792 [Cafeteria roenbergensis]|eukprot:KAA0153349.1 hypothetical protein FNF29_03166 [Cafeteria roenbergensis]
MAAAIAGDPLFWAGVAVGAVGVGLMAVRSAIAFPALPDPEPPLGEPIAAEDTEIVDVYELEHRPGSVGSLSGFCLAVEAHLKALGLPYKSRLAFSEKFPPRGKAPYIEHFSKGGRMVGVGDSDAINAYLMSVAGTKPGRMLEADSEVTNSGRRGTIWLLKRLTTDRIYFVGMYSAVVPGAWDEGAKSAMPWPIGALFQMYLRRSMLDQCRSAAGGIGRFSFKEAMASIEPDLDVVEEAVARLAGADGFMSGLARPCSSEVSMWAHMVPCIFEAADSDLGRSVQRRPRLCAWLLRVATHLFPERVAAARCVLGE